MRKVVFFLSALLYFLLLFETPRENFWQTSLLWGLLFIGYFWVLRYFFLERKIKYTCLLPTANWKLALLAAVAFRIIAWLALPELSDDYFRFLWDGQLLAHGDNPFSRLPSAYTAAEYAGLGLSQTLFEGLNSPDYHSIYPPVCQGVFYLAASIFPDNIYASVLLMKGIFFLAEVGSIFLIIQLLRHWKQDINKVFLYALNPLVIVELVGNLHFECLMIFFLLLSLWLLLKVNWQFSAIAFGLAVSSKLIPLMFLPLLIRRIGFWQTMAYGSIVMLILLLGFLPIFDVETFLHLLESVQLYFQQFEFNAGIYYLLRAVGKWLTGYNLILYLGPALSLLSFAGIMWIAFRRKKVTVDSLPLSMLAVLLLYLLLATTVHPWYVIPLVALATFCDFRFPYIWSALLILTYATYQTAAYEENMYLMALEYAALFALLYLERGKWKLLYR